MGFGREKVVEVVEIGSSLELIITSMGGWNFVSM